MSLCLAISVARDYGLQVTLGAWAVGPLRSLSLSWVGGDPVKASRELAEELLLSATTHVKRLGERVVENVASMDPAASDEISVHLGCEPLRLDPADVFPYSRPRFAWISEVAVATEGSKLSRRKGLSMTGEAVAEAQWILPGWARVQNTCPLPTFMKSIVRTRPLDLTAPLRMLLQGGRTTSSASPLTSTKRRSC